ncbi:MAG: hypothetical protein M3463_22955 [Verrucomicrobiota bacterium]|nr:hypothetical protein [Verrucomicrobiota bacterium]
MHSQWWIIGALVCLALLVLTIACTRRVTARDGSSGGAVQDEEDATTGEEQEPEFRVIITDLPPSVAGAAETDSGQTEENTKLYPRILKAVQNDGFLDSRAIDVLTRNAEQAVSDLNRLIQTAGPSNVKLKVAAAETLFRMKVPEGREQVLALLREEKSEIRKATLQAVRVWIDDFPKGEPQRSVFLSLLDDADPEVRVLAASCLQDVTGLAPRLLEMLPTLAIAQQIELERQFTFREDLALVASRLIAHVISQLWQARGENAKALLGILLDLARRLDTEGARAQAME